MQIMGEGNGNIEYSLSDDGQTFNLRLSTGDDGIGVAMEASELSALIANLAAWRERMPDQVSHSIDPGTRIGALIEPQWRMSPVGPSGHRVLVIRHPGLGWLGFALNKKQIGDLRRALR